MEGVSLFQHMQAYPLRMRSYRATQVVDYHASEGLKDYFPCVEKHRVSTYIFLPFSFPGDIDIQLLLVLLII